MAIKRQTRRKRIVHAVLSASTIPALLEELRWNCFREERKGKGLEMPQSYHKSFARTIRCNCPDLVISKLPHPEELPSGLVTRAAVYRLRHWSDIERFLNSPEACAYCKYQGRNKGKFARPEVRCDLYANPCPDPDLRYGGFSEPPTRVDVRLFPVSSPLTLVGIREATRDDIVRLASVDWPIFRCHYCNDLLIQPTESIRRKWRRYTMYRDVRQLSTEDISHHLFPLNFDQSLGTEPIDDVPF
ncbi:MAG: hypothetical protein WEB58_07445 [Planctomycetaceae bacterium]